MSHTDDAVRGPERVSASFPLVRWLSMAVVLLLLIAGLVACGQPTEETETEGEVEVETSPLLEEEPEASPLLEEEPEASPSPDDELEASPSPDDELEASPSPEADVEASPSPEGEQADKVFLDDITANSAAYFGRLVRVDGIVDEVSSDDGIFTIVRNEGDPNEVPVVLAEQTDAPLAQGEAVQVVGTIQELALDQLEQELGRELDAEFLEEYASNAIIVARSLEQPSAETGASPSPAAEATIADITGNVAQYDGQVVTLEGEVQEVLSPSAFAIVENAATDEPLESGVLVLALNESTSTVGPGDRIRATGTVKPFTGSVLEDEGGGLMGYHFDETLPFEPWVGRPAIVVEQVEIVEE